MSKISRFCDPPPPKKILVESLYLSRSRYGTVKFSFQISQLVRKLWSECRVSHDAGQKGFDLLEAPAVAAYII